MVQLKGHRIGRRHARLDLQRDADRRRAGARGLPEGIRGSAMGERPGAARHGLEHVIDRYVRFTDRESGRKSFRDFQRVESHRSQAALSGPIRARNDMPHSFHTHAPHLQDRFRQDRQLLVAARARQDLSQRRPPAGLDAHRPRVGAAQLRRQEGDARARRRGRRLAGERAAPGRDPVRRRPRRPAGLHRRAAARRPGGDAHRRRADGQGRRKRSSRWCRSTSSSTTR